MRDYIHVEDLAAGHVAALGRIAAHDQPLSVWNLGTGRGTSASSNQASTSVATTSSRPQNDARRAPSLRAAPMPVA